MIRYYLKTKDSNVDEVCLTPNYSVNTIFSEYQKKMFEHYFKYYAFVFYGLCVNECSRIAYEMALVSNLKISDS